MPSLNFIPGGLVTTTQALFDDSEHSSFSFQKSLSDLDDYKKSSSTDNFSSDSLSEIQDQELGDNCATPTPEKQHSIVEETVERRVTENLIEKTIQVRDAVRNSNNDVWNSYYESIKQGQTLIKRCF